MAPIFLSIFLALFTAMVSGIPMNAARQAGTSVVTVSTWTTVDVPVTLWVDQNGNPLSTVVGSPTPAAPAASTASTTSISQAPPAPVQPMSPSTTFATISTTASINQVQVQPVVPVAAPSTSVAVPVPASASAPAPAPAAASSPAAAYSSPAYSAPAAPPSSPAAAAPSASPVSSSSGSSGIVQGTTSNTCIGTSDACQGDITYYSGGLGACGYNIDTTTDLVIALPFAFMGSLSNSNPYCKQSVTIQNPTTGQKIQATVGDKCMGCVGRSIDLTEAAFQAVGNGCDGRCSGFNWWFNNPVPGV